MRTLRIVLQIWRSKLALEYVKDPLYWKYHTSLYKALVGVSVSSGAGNSSSPNLLQQASKGLEGESLWCSWMAASWMARSRTSAELLMSSTKVHNGLMSHNLRRGATRHLKISRCYQRRRQWLEKGYVTRQGSPDWRLCFECHYHCWHFGKSHPWWHFHAVDTHHKQHLRSRCDALSHYHIFTFTMLRIAVFVGRHDAILSITQCGNVKTETNITIRIGLLCHKVSSHCNAVSTKVGHWDLGCPTWHWHMSMFLFLPKARALKVEMILPYSSAHIIPTHITHITSTDAHNGTQILCWW